MSLTNSSTSLTSLSNGRFSCSTPNAYYSNICFSRGRASLQRYSTSDDDSGCVFDEYSWVPNARNLDIIHNYFSALPKDKVPYINSSGEKWRFEQLMYQLPPQDSDSRYCANLTIPEEYELRAFEKARINLSLGIGLIGKQLHNESKSYCYQCKGAIKLDELVVTAPERFDISAVWHPHCFVCVECKELIVDLIYFKHNQNVFCGRHHAEQVKKRCTACDELIFSKVNTEIDGRFWHINHFCCDACNCSLIDQRYVQSNEQNCQKSVLCIQCFENSTKFNVCCKQTSRSQQNQLLDFGLPISLCACNSTKKCCAPVVARNVSNSNDHQQSTCSSMMSCKKSMSPISFVSNVSPILEFSKSNKNQRQQFEINKHDKVLNYPNQCPANRPHPPLSTPPPPPPSLPIPSPPKDKSFASKSVVLHENIYETVMGASCSYSAAATPEFGRQEKLRLENSSRQNSAYESYPCLANSGQIKLPHLPNVASVSPLPRDQCWKNNCYVEKTFPLNTFALQMYGPNVCRETSKLCVCYQQKACQCNKIRTTVRSCKNDKRVKKQWVHHHKSNEAFSSTLSLNSALSTSKSSLFQENLDWSAETYPINKNNNYKFTNLQLANKRAASADGRRNRSRRRRRRRRQQFSYQNLKQITVPTNEVNKHDNNHGRQTNIKNNSLQKPAKQLDLDDESDIVSKKNIYQCCHFQNVYSKMPSEDWLQTTRYAIEKRREVLCKNVLLEQNYRSKSNYFSSSSSDSEDSDKNFSINNKDQFFTHRLSNQHFVRDNCQKQPNQIFQLASSLSSQDLFSSKSNKNAVSREAQKYILHAQSQSQKSSNKKIKKNKANNNCIVS